MKATRHKNISKLAVSLVWSPERKTPVGTLYRSQVERLIFFEYDASFLKKNISISPFHLACLPGATQAKTDEHAFFGLHGVFADSLPDGWGLLIMAQAMRRLNASFAETGALDKLAFIGSKGMGALVYEPSIERAGEKDFALNLASLSDDAHRVLDGSADDVLSELLLIGGSPGGARPKIVAAVEKEKMNADFFAGRLISGHSDTYPKDYEPWLIKFGSREDNADAAFIEFLYSKTAQQVGICVEPTALFRDKKGRTWFGMRRFDRLPENGRCHTHTLAGLLHANFRIPSLDYQSFLKATYALTRSLAETENAFRLAVFNAVFHNRDDHAKNFSFRMSESGEWQLAPAYDLTWAEGPGGEHTTTYMGEGRNPTDEHFLGLAKSVGIPEKSARHIVDEVRGGMEFLKKRAKEMGVKSILKKFRA